MVVTGELTYETPSRRHVNEIQQAIHSEANEHVHEWQDLRAKAPTSRLWNVIRS